MAVIDWGGGAAVVGWVVVGLTAIATLCWRVWCSRPHLPNSCPSGVLPARFARERETMFVPLLQRLGLTTEFEGYLVTADPELTRTLMMSKSHTARRSRWYRASSYVLPAMDGVLNMDGSTWLRHSRALAATFHASNVGRYAASIHAIATRHADAWVAGRTASDGVLEVGGRGGGVGGTGGGGPDLLEAVRGIGMEIVMMWGYGIVPTHPLAHTLARHLTRYGVILGGMAQRPLRVACSYMALTQCGRDIADTVTAIVAERAAHPDAIVAAVPGSVNGLDAMVAGGLTPAEVGGEVNHIHGAHKAAAFSIVHALHDLCQLPLPDAVVDGVLPISRASGSWWQQRMVREVIRACGMDGVPTRDDLATRMPLTQAILLEVRRKHVVSLGVVRRTGEPLTIDGTVIPGGTEVVVLLQALHHLPAFWKAPHEFRPERWLTPTSLTAALAAEGGVVVEGGVDSGSPAVRMRDGTMVVCGGDVCGSAVPALDRGASAASSASAGDDGDSVEEGGGTSRGSHATYSSKREVAASAAAAPHPMAYIPFLTGSRMCAGKVLAEVEMLVVLAAILRRATITTRTEYLYHVNGKPVGAGVGAPIIKKQRAALAIDAAAYSGKSPVVVTIPDGDGITSGSIVVHPAYTGPIDLIMAENMYSTIEGDVPFVAQARAGSVTADGAGERVAAP